MKEFNYILEKVFADNRLSRSEKDALDQVIAAQAYDEQQLALLRSQLFDYVKGLKLTKAVIDCLEDVNKALLPKTEKKASVNSYFSPGEECRSAIIEQIQMARSSLDICVFTISDNIIVDRILEAWNRGVKVRIVSDNDKQYDRGSDIFRMKDAGIPIRTDYTEDHMHHKFAVIDNCSAIIGSYNWTRSAALNNNEDLIVIDDKSTIENFSKEFEKLWKAFA